MANKSNLNLEFLKHPLDDFWQATIIKIIPKTITPNHLSIVRIAFSPLILVLIFFGYYFLALALFFIIALTDSLDGALARQRQQITSLGLILDPLADKLLIIGILAFFLIHYPFPELIIYSILFEIIVIISGYFWIKIFNKPVLPSNIWGKFKMVSQSLGVILIFIWLIIPTSFTLYFSAYTLLLSLIFLIMSAIAPKKS